MLCTVCCLVYYIYNALEYINEYYPIERSLNTFINFPNVHQMTTVPLLGYHLVLKFFFFFLLL